jgi:hypothetical protein
MEPKPKLFNKAMVIDTFAMFLQLKMLLILPYVLMVSMGYVQFTKPKSHAHTRRSNILGRVCRGSFYAGKVALRFGKKNLSFLIATYGCTTVIGTVLKPLYHRP